ncbi:hypothetical protein BH23ACT7_BH23ACT7_24410 [soil metagenome]
MFDDRPDLEALGAAAAGCTDCDLYRNATQTVFGEGPADADVMFVGEQPGDQEDRQGQPFVGPAGRLLDEALVAAGIDRTRAYVTNTVKHFKFTPRGKRRIHSKPNAQEIRACRQWLDGEFAAVDPRVVVALGATAAKALLARRSRSPPSAARSSPGPTAAWSRHDPSVGDPADGRRRPRHRLRRSRRQPPCRGGTPGRLRFDDGQARRGDRRWHRPHP